MFTIVIDTTGGKVFTSHDILFSAAFNCDEIAFESECRLKQASECCDRINNILDVNRSARKKYGLIIVVDMRAFEKSLYFTYSDLYKKLIKLYISNQIIRSLIQRGIEPQRALVLYADYANSNALYASSPQKGIIDLFKAGLESDTFPRLSIGDKDNMLVFDEILKAELNFFDNKEIHADEIVSSEVYDDEYTISLLNELHPFDFVAKKKDDEATEESKQQSELERFALDVEMRFNSMGDDCERIPDKQNEMDSYRIVPVDEVVCKFSDKTDELRENGYFKLAVYVYWCALDGVNGSPEYLLRDLYDIENGYLEEVAARARKKYQYFADLKNEDEKFERILLPEELPTEKIMPTEEMIESLEKIRSHYPIISKMLDGEEPETKPTFIQKILRIFFAPGKEFKDMYNQIIAQNSEGYAKVETNDIIKTCKNVFYEWRDSPGAKAVKETEICERDKPSTERDDFASVEKEYKEKITNAIKEERQINDDIADYKNAVLEAEKINVKYEELMDKYKKKPLNYLMAALAIGILFFPYFYIQFNSMEAKNSTIILFASYLIGLTAVYLLASIFYSWLRRKELKGLSYDIQKLKNESERARVSSLQKVKTLYSITLPQAERLSKYLEVMRERDCRNSKKALNNNAHASKLKQLINSTDALLSSLGLGHIKGKLPFDKSEYKLAFSEEFSSQKNKKLYMFIEKEDLSLDKLFKDKKDGEK